MHGQAEGRGLGRRDRRLIALAAIGLVLVVFWLTPLRERPPSGEPGGGSAPTTLPAPLPQATAPARLTPPPPAGSVTVQPGPYDARVGLSGLRFAREPLAGVTGSARLLGQEFGTATIGLRVDFYDAGGARIGGAVQVLRQPAAFARDPSGRRRPFPFAITLPNPLPNAIAARIAVTTLAIS